MTEYDDTLIDMSDVDDKVDDETETSSSEIDDNTSSTDRSELPPRCSLDKSSSDLYNSNNNNGNEKTASSDCGTALDSLKPSTEIPKPGNLQAETGQASSHKSAIPEREEQDSGSSSHTRKVPKLDSSDTPTLHLSQNEPGNNSGILRSNSEPFSREDRDPPSTDTREPEGSGAATPDCFDGQDLHRSPEELAKADLEPGITVRSTEDNHASRTKSDSDFEPSCADLGDAEPSDPQLEVHPGAVLQGDCVEEELSGSERDSFSTDSPDSKEVLPEAGPLLLLAFESGNSESQEDASGQALVTNLDIDSSDSETTVTTTTTYSPNGEAVVTTVTTTNDSNISNITDSITNNTATFTDSQSQLEPAAEVTMGENARVEEKLRQFEDNKKDEGEDTRGTYTGSNSSLSEIEKQRRRNLIFDEERFEETFLKCLICREVYNDRDKLPKMLHCHHTFCMDCLFQMYRVEGEFRQSLTGVFRHGMPMTVKIQCPTCREGIIISETELRRLPNDHTIMELLCFVNQTGKNEVQYCTKHQMQPLNFFCEPCIMPVCCDCTVIDHKESKGHIVVNVDEAMKKYTPIVEQTLTDIRQEKSNIVDKRAALEAAQDDLDRIQKDLARQVRSVFDSIREILDEREKELYDASEAEIERKREVLEGHMKTLSERDAMLNTEFNELQKAKDDKDISLIFTGHKSAREALSKKVYVPTNSTKGFAVTFQFSSRADSVIKQNVANLGDIIFQS